MAKLRNENAAALLSGRRNVSSFWLSMVVPFASRAPIRRRTVFLQNRVFCSLADRPSSQEARMNSTTPHHCQTDIGSPMNSAPTMQGTIRPAVENAVTITMVPLCMASSMHSCAAAIDMPAAMAAPTVTWSNDIAAGSSAIGTAPRRKAPPNRQAMYRICPIIVAGNSWLERLEQ